MRRRLTRSLVPAGVLARADLARGDKVLAGAEAGDGRWLVGTRDALVIVPVGGPATRVPWEQVAAADWDRDDERLRVSEVGEYGHVRPVHVFEVPDAGRLLAMVRERVTASVVLQRRVVVEGRRGFSVIARRPPRGTGRIAWAFELDEGVDPEDPTVRQLTEAALRTAQEELGEADAGADGAFWR